MALWAIGRSRLRSVQLQSVCVRHVDFIESLKHANVHLTPTEKQALLRTVDGDGDGVIDYREFESIIHSMDKV